MKLSGLKEIWQRHPSVKRLSVLVTHMPEQPVYLQGLQGSAVALTLAAVQEKLASKGYSVLVVLNDEDEAGFLYQDLVNLLGEDEVLFLPSGYRRAVRFGKRDEAAQILRTEVVSRLGHAEKGLFVVTYPEALAVRVSAETVNEEHTLEVTVGQTIAPTHIQARLLDMGYQRVDYVYEPGQFSVRGSILDVFSYSYEYPYRLDFFGDDLDSLRTFDIETQLSKEMKKNALFVGSQAAQGSEMVSLWTLLSADTVLVMRSETDVCAQIKQTFQKGFLKQAVVESELSQTDETDENLPKLSVAELCDDSGWAEQTVQMPRWLLSGVPVEGQSVVVAWNTIQTPLFHKNMELLSQSFREQSQQKGRICLLAEDKLQHERVREILDGLGIDTPFDAVDGTLHAGFTDQETNLCIYTDHEIFDRFHRYHLRSERASSGKTAQVLKEIGQLTPGDYVVHLDHGVGRFEGLVRLERDGVEQEVIKLTYQGGDVVYVGIHALGKISKYKGRETEEPRLNRLGSGAWEHLKERTKRKVKDIARNLIKLYGQRLRAEGYAFHKDTYLQHELEASFPYEDTPDQKRVTEEVKADMEKGRPMDRLICGDVGFGKTEIAIRASYKAAVDGKQVAVLVPTTLLAYQHYKTFSERLEQAGARVAYLTRAQSAARTREILEKLENGQIDIIVGTQKLIGKNVKFKDLGLLVIDEEQKFGVAAKERLREMRVGVDTLAMSATPIPRTLQFSLMGARDLSVLRTPPEGRMPIHTEVHLFGHEVIADAVSYELNRGGQVYVVCNRILSLPALKTMIETYVPQARVAIGHGQMPPQELEKQIMAFIQRDYDVLLSTTIVENGIDIPNANTIIVTDAHRYGLSDLHQMRGRVGRSNKKAFCFLLAPPVENLTPEARRRLEALENFTHLGSGLQIAMQDLDIRGAGNLLGAEQSGFIADLGYETYQKVLSQAVAELHNEEQDWTEPTEEATACKLEGDVFVAECNLESDLPLYFSEEFVPGDSERLDLYRQLQNIVSDEELAAFRTQLEDRFGALPAEAEDLLRVTPLRRLGKSLGIERMVLKQQRLVFYFVSDSNSLFYKSTTFHRILTYLTHNPFRGNMEERNGKLRLIVPHIKGIGEVIRLCQSMLKQTPDF